MADPIKQFNVYELAPLSLGGVDVSFTNSSLWMVIAVATVTAMMVFGMGRRALVPGRMQSFIEMLYEFIANMVIDIAGPEAKRYFPFIFSVFMFVLFGNLLGMIPASFTFTSHISVTFALAFICFLVITFIGFARHGLDYLKLFLPTGSPLFLAPLLIPIELFSYFARPFSLAIRLFANMLAGHVVLKIFAGFSVALATSFGILAAVVPAFVTIGLIGFEIFVACLQAYIFALLCCVYLNDAVHMH